MFLFCFKYILFALVSSFLYVNLAPVMNIAIYITYINLWILILISVHPYNTWMVCTDLCYIRPSAVVGLGQWVEHCNLIMLGFQLLSNWASRCFSLTLFSLSLSRSFLSLSLSHLSSPLNALHSLLMIEPSFGHGQAFGVHGNFHSVREK